MAKWLLVVWFSFCGDSACTSYLLLRWAFGDSYSLVWLQELLSFVKREGCSMLSSCGRWACLWDICFLGLASHLPRLCLFLRFCLWYLPSLTLAWDPLAIVDRCRTPKSCFVSKTNLQAFPRLLLCSSGWLVFEQVPVDRIDVGLSKTLLARLATTLTVLCHKRSCG